MFFCPNKTEPLTSTSKQQSKPPWITPWACPTCPNGRHRGWWVGGLAKAIDRSRCDIIFGSFWISCEHPDGLAKRCLGADSTNVVRNYEREVYCILGRGSALVWNFQRIETFDIDFVIGCFWYFWKLEHVWCIDHDFPYSVTSGLEAKDHLAGSVWPFHERLAFQMLQFPQFSWDHIHKLLGIRGPAFPTFSFFLFIEIIYVDHKMIE